MACHKSFADNKDEYSRNVEAFKNGGNAEVQHGASTNKSTFDYDQRSVLSRQQGTHDDSSQWQSSLHTNFTDVSDITVGAIHIYLWLQ